LLYAGILAFVAAVLCIATVHPLLTRKKPVRYCAVVFLLNSLLVFLALGISIRLIPNQTLLKYVHYLCAFGYLAYIWLVFEGSIWKKLFAMFSVWLFSMIAILAGTSLAELFSAYLSDLGVHYLVHVFRALIEALLLVAVVLWIGRPYRRVLDMVSDRMVAVMSTYPVLAFLLLVNNYFLSYGYTEEFDSTWKMLFLASFIVLGYILVFAGISSASQIASLESDLRAKARDLSERERAAIEQEKIIAELQQATSHVRQLRGLLPICASCKKIRNDEGYWEQLESYIGSRSDADFSHAICPECASRLYPDRREKK
jgi:membrane-associated protease RseP (regulator of RpoE activity)